MNIERTLFWFSDGNNNLLSLNKEYFGLGYLLNRLLNENYEGKKIKFINIYFRTEETYKLYPQASKNIAHFHGGVLTYDDVFDLYSFNKMTKKDQNSFIWERAFEILREASISIKNEDLLRSSEYAYKKGIKIDLNIDYRMVENDIDLFNDTLKASVWVNFKDESMYSKFTLEKENKIIFEKLLDASNTGNEFFLEMYKNIEFDSHNIIIKGHKDVEYLPLKIPISEIMVD
ncbi:hypothetical protein [Aquimarina algiphila]|uniref:hypothetical protein n=1 Tax=Aquimarina algiphila TaxID=2047982 RepID=UPI0024904A29|nr:hypothetical protein [Aquimarina algiphila]